MAVKFLAVEDRIAYAVRRLRVGAGVGLLSLLAFVFASGEDFLTAFGVGALVAAIMCAAVGFRSLVRIALDLSAQLKRAEDRTVHDARHDRLTGLPNRAYLIEYLDVTINHAERHNHSVGLCLIDLHGLKRVNEAHGVATGDAALKRFANFIRRGTRKGDFVARIGSDEFVIVSALIDDISELEQMAARLARGIQKPFEINGASLEFGSAAGVVGSVRGEVDPHRLITNAAIALRDAKSRRKECAVFDAGMRDAFDAAQKLRLELADALEAGEITPWFQPQVESDDERRVIGFEALARWVHPERGVLGPEAFFDIAEDFSLMERIDEVVLDAALDALVEWRAAGLVAPQVSVNVSALRLRDPFLTERIKWALESRNLEPQDLCIEVLESVLIEGEADETAKNLATLSRIGVCVDLDDFGTGHAAISTLKRVKVDRVKIDRAFITGIDHDPAQIKVAQKMVDLALSLDVDALAEGVETDGEFDQLAKIGCGAAQGYAIAKPMSKELVAEWLGQRGEIVEAERASA